MKRRLFNFASLVLFAVISSYAGAEETVTPHWNADPNADIFKIGKFDEPPDINAPPGWMDLSAFGSGNGTLGRGFVSLNLLRGDTKTYIETTIDVPESAKYLTFFVRLRGPTLERNSEPDSGAGVRFTLISGDAQRRSPRMEPRYEGYRNWACPIQTMQVQPGETRLRVTAEVSKATGSLEIDSILVVPSDIANEATKEQEQQLDEALRKDDPELIRRLVESAPHMLNIRTGGYDNGTPLTRTAWMGAPKAAAMLIKLGADIEAKDTNWGNTPLRWCCWWGVSEVAEALMEAGADARGAANMARSSKTNNVWATRKPEDFDRTAKVIEDYLAKRNAPQ